MRKTSSNQNSVANQILLLLLSIPRASLAPTSCPARCNGLTVSVEGQDGGTAAGFTLPLINSVYNGLLTCLSTPSITLNCGEIEIMSLTLKEISLERDSSDPHSEVESGWSDVQRVAFPPHPRNIFFPFSA